MSQKILLTALYVYLRGSFVLPGVFWAFVEAAFVGEVADEVVHGAVVGVADEAGTALVGGDQASVYEAVYVVGQGRAGNASLLLELVYVHAPFTGPDQTPVDYQPHRRPQRAHRLRRPFDVHFSQYTPYLLTCN